MKKKHLILLLLVLAASLTLSACTGSRFQTTSWPGITIFEDDLFVAQGQRIYQIDPTNGAELTRIPRETDAKSPTYFAPPVITEDGQLFIGSYNNNLYTYNINNGTENWMFANDNRFIASVLLVDEMIYAPNADHTLHALNMSGTEQWSFETEGPLWAKPVYDGEKLYLASMDHHLYALNHKTGNEIWSIDLGGTTVTSPEISEDGVLYLGTFESEVLAIRSSNGVEVWSFQANDWIWAPPALVDDIIYATDISGWLYALEADTGKLLWNFKGEGQVSGTPLVTEDGVYIGTGDGNFYALDLEGKLRWNRFYKEDSLLLGDPVLAGEFVIVPVSGVEAILVAYDANGTIQWEFVPGN
ncbi:MAG: PQQ-binding-like beta-propeller repeat protein [Chloroflexi bacterium]|jgi:outer membrane protein assembly factor BamB|nr:PQQ-binding-like beta-propeller repeat protein [Chloroflexota bacterium]MBT3670962.1 PQQ-binding-like beta-propeller repeat protein [Chloroflexota bacterium]MBT4002142.1 PQQ-binding-like beta-propeller repeat protein [Chloroflexota bacterium]MBT4306324.1 PQQ-binding-like beta-propeller repeat protein [Chloroflexota bacterium]MBT4532795.1 PQQ-binding-like beta-propeller repeat protein [Chloroflexota bacterium]